MVSQAGGVLLVETARKSGLDTAISAALVPWRRPRTVHDPGKILLDMALAVALGGDCLADVGMLRAEPAVFGPVASDPTVSRLVDHLAAAGPKAQDAIRTARAGFVHESRRRFDTTPGVARSYGEAMSTTSGGTQARRRGSRQRHGHARPPAPVASAFVLSTPQAADARVAARVPDRLRCLPKP